MPVVETERHGQILVVRMNRPERLNALNHEMRTLLAETWTEFRHSDELEVAIFTGTGRGFCAGEDMKESLANGAPGGRRPAIEDPFMSGALEKPVIAAVNGFAMGGGFMLVERTDLRVAVRGAVFEVSEAKRWLLGGYNHGHVANLPYPIAMEMALGFRFTAERFYDVGFLNRLVDADELMPSALAMAEHLLTLPPASRVNTVHMMRQMRPAPSAEQQRLAAALHEHGAKSDLMESRAAFAEKRPPQFKGWDDPQDRYPAADARYGEGLSRGDQRTSTSSQKPTRSSHLRHLRLRRFVDPGVAHVADAVDHDVVELHAVRAFEVVVGLLPPSPATPCAPRRAGSSGSRRPRRCRRWRRSDGRSGLLSWTVHLLSGDICRRPSNCYCRR